VNSFLTVHQHILGYSVPENGVNDVIFANSTSYRTTTRLWQRKKLKYTSSYSCEGLCKRWTVQCERCGAVVSDEWVAVYTFRTCRTEQCSFICTQSTL